MVYVYVQREDSTPSPEELVHINRFLAAFAAKKGGEPVGTWRVPRAGYCIFYPPPLTSPE